MPRQTLAKRQDGRYCCKYKGKCFYGDTQSEAISKKKQYEKLIEDGIKGEKIGITVSEYSTKWLPISKPDVSKRTYNQYNNCINVLNSHIGDKKMMKVVQSDIKAIYASVIDKSKSYIHVLSIIINGVFESAVNDGCIKQNPCKGIKLPKGYSGTHRVITDEERNLILTVNHRMKPMAMVMLYAGLRRGEAIAINIDTDIDFQKKRISVNRAIRYDGNEPIVSSPKTESGVREVPLLDELERVLSDSRGLLCRSASGKQLSETAFQRGWESYMNALSEAAGHKISIRCHDLRHSYCTMLRDAGVDIKLVIKWMGHTDEKMILRVYDHITDNRIADSVDKLNKISLASKNK